VHRYKRPPNGTLEVFAQLAEVKTVKNQDGIEYSVIEYSYTLNTSVTPSEIDLHWAAPEKARTSKGIYKIENDVLWLSLEVFESYPRPHDFKGNGPSQPVLKARRSK
jgi:uncharacterized protein (TIGR03067 family)